MSNNFECQESCKGKCCKFEKGNEGFVFLTEQDRRRLALAFGSQHLSFVERVTFDKTRFTDRKTSQWVLKSKDTSCVFFQGGQCSVYNLRPTQCRTFPYWPENLNTSKWKELGEYCPGIDQGSDYQKKVLLTQQIEADTELAKNGSV